MAQDLDAVLAHLRHRQEDLDYHEMIFQTFQPAGFTRAQLHELREDLHMIREQVRNLREQVALIFRVARLAALFKRRRSFFYKQARHLAVMRRGRHF